MADVLSPGILAAGGDADHPLTATPAPPATLLDQAVKQYPVLGKYGIQYKESPGRSGNMLESWPPGEPGSGNYMRPQEFPLDKFGIEVFDQKTRPIDILGDAVSHYLITADPTVKSHYDNFQKSISPDQERRLKEQYKHAVKHEEERRPYAQWREMTGVPAYFRGYPFQQWPADFNRRAYTPDQMKNLDSMMEYLRGGR